MSQRRASEGGVFGDYDLDPSYYDEMFGTDGSARQACRRLNAALAELAPEDLTRLQEGVYRHFLHEGITFTVLDAERVTEQIIPIDCVPRVLTAAEWEHIERGLKQRLTALNLFLKDVYHDGRCLRDKIVPIDLVLGCPQYRMEMRGLKVPHDVYVAVCGTDIVRTNDGFAVLEDNLRVPSGVSYMLACRNAIKDAFPRLYRAHRVREVADYAERLYSTLASLRPSLQDPQVAILTPGIHNSAYYEHAFLAGEMGIHLVEGQDLVLRDGALHMRTTAGLRRIDVLYRRIDDDYLDPVMFRGESVLGAAGLFHAYRTGNLVLANAPGTGVADDKSLYSYVPAIIRYFLGEEPILANVETHLCREPGGLAYTLEHLEELVVKEVGGAGGYGMLVGPHASAEERATYAERVRADPANFISQPVLALSRAPCFVGGAIEPRHVDLRPFVLQGRDEQHVVPGGLCRVALRRGSLVVNSSQGGGCKDLWILED
ncbi:MAG: circularly permuted type 2 ATP-grasp protein [Deltaproteobacteria bacterium]|nr:circularly permuted type 2 ATP-grasp protein [Deltaproteobacteria bacterium]